MTENPLQSTLVLAVKIHVRNADGTDREASIALAASLIKMKALIKATLLSVILVAPALGQNLTLDSYEKARQLVDKSLNAYGGLEELRSLANFTVRLEGTDFHRNQSPRPGVPFATARIFEMTMDLKKGRYRLYFERSGVGSYVVRSIEVSDTNERTYADLRLKTKTVGPARPNWRETLPAQLLPQMVLVNGYGRIGQARFIGRQTYEGRPHDIVAFPASGSNVVSLYFDTETGLISKQEELVSDSYSGDALVETVFNGYQTTGRFKVPTEVVNSTAGVITSRVRYSRVSFDRDIAEGEFLLDSDIMAVSPQQPAQREESPVKKIADNVYTASVPGYKVLFVDFTDHIWVLEAPLGDAAARNIIRQIKETIPNKSIKYVAVTHHHDDHASGARAFVAEGATLLTTRGNRSHFEELMKSRFTILPDALSKTPRPLKMEFIEGRKKVLTDGRTTVELYDIGPNPHADELLVAYLPKERIIFQADLGDKPAGDLWIANPAIEHFANWMKAKGLAVDQIISAHGTFMTVADYQKAVENAQKTAQ